MRTHGDIVIVEGSDYLCKDIYESDNISGTLGYKEFDNGVIWNLGYAPNYEINVGVPDSEKIKNPPQYFIFYPWYPDHTMDVIRVSIREPRYLTGYNETRKFDDDELDWFLSIFNKPYTWENFLMLHNNEREIWFNLPPEIWEMPDYSLLREEI